MIEDRLLAKSLSTIAPPEGNAHLLSMHLYDVYLAAREILIAMGSDQLAAMGISCEQQRRFQQIVLLAAALHDLGKANDHFQDMIKGHRRTQSNPQGVRHEWISLLLIERLREWLLPAVERREEDLAMIQWVIAGHHPSITHASPPTNAPSGSGTTVRGLLDHDDFAEILSWVARTFALADAPLPSRTKVDFLLTPPRVFEEIARWARRAERLWDERIRKSEDRRLLAAAKACLIAADVAGSALPRVFSVGEKRCQWIRTALSTKPASGDLQKIVDFRLAGQQPRPFQRAVADSSALVTFVKAGCGTGKTLAAYLWAARNHPTRRLYFCYPTTGTATEGFRDYLFDPGSELDGIDAKLFHSRRDIDFEIILDSGGDIECGKDDSIAKLASLESWSTPIVACTVDTVLGLVQNNRRGLFAWPAIAQAAIVFDEIHSYDDRLFGSFLRFLRDLPGIPALLMTASLPEKRLSALRDVLSVHRGIDLTPIEGPMNLESMPRYHRLGGSDGSLTELLRQSISRGEKVLWVCNTVGRILEAAGKVANHDIPVLLYHSRFKYIDRVARHKAVIDAFSLNRSGPVVAICSQVAEMSLDLKGCTLLITDLAPVPSLIQRLGRLNRHAVAGDPTRPFLVIEPDQFLPYDRKECDAARDWLASLPAEISQYDLVARWEQDNDASLQLIDSAWLDGGPRTLVNELREASPGITVLMEGDVSRIEQSSDLGKYTLPMPPPPRNMEWQKWPRFNGIPVASENTISYDPSRGAEWRK